MVGVTPVGVITDKPAESRHFYGTVMGIERVQTLRRLFMENMEGVILRLESPAIEVLETETKVLERPVNQTVRREFRMIMRPRDIGGVLFRLAKEGITPQTSPYGSFVFDDLNGISWEIKTGFQGMVFDNPLSDHPAGGRRPS
ncbi:MAG: hypothetical protein GX442_24930 [Candidatus Riflebacteria bacterium]|nr:hypothetical protein [Candidatus Riflebacteria bacterium]